VRHFSRLPKSVKKNITVGLKIVGGLLTGESIEEHKLPTGERSTSLIFYFNKRIARIKVPGDNNVISFHPVLYMGIEVADVVE
jgi:hypothetical protein